MYTCGANNYLSPLSDTRDVQTLVHANLFIKGYERSQPKTLQKNTNMEGRQHVRGEQ